MVKKQLIMEKALELFGKQGFNATSVQQITDDCGISKGAFYLSFKSKDELILALIDQFTEQSIADFDYIVKNTNKNQLLCEFYKTSYHYFRQHADFAKTLIKEAFAFNDEDLITKLRHFDKLLEKLILTMIERVYEETVTSSKYDLLYCIKSFMGMYNDLILFCNIELDMDTLIQSLVEKTNLIAENMTIPFMTEQHLKLLDYGMDEEITEKELINILKQKIAEIEGIEESIEKESLILLHQNLLESNLSPAIVKGLLENIRSQPNYAWIAYLLRNYYEL
ncbi:TetR/AcrR family transcriptional regulator [Pseudogracilibacillus auburnensis]|uniref:TetR family transcriptional regulator n=1 Tax=Pseudogracilibacillus auburnensis TaxID=1494959 RepID=A0A2V3W7P3_9BACI|nr:TetR/AcrR family transcriptional regulator [Pseudogracilibacillus auburnensis]MBO1001917.1 TetR/AcrR family transcriptional regulator [Pseudogracilibacillus auburnensis]PXW90132.1 TetR family transcriptional regulator [Pseudogracilibacillus auburnensis]